MNANAQDNKEAPNVASPRTYILTFLALVLLTILTVDLSRGMNLGQFSLAAGMAVATAKSLLVLLIFMHVLHESKMVILILIASAFFISLFWGMTVLDTRTRGLNDHVETEGYYQKVNNLPTILDIEANSAGKFDSNDSGAADSSADSSKGTEKADAKAAAADDHQADADAKAPDADDHQADAEAEAPADKNSGSDKSTDAKDSAQDEPSGGDSDKE